MIKELHKLRIKDSGKFGAKACYLGEMMNFGVNVPNGFVVLQNYDKKSVKEYFEQLDAKYVAVRSSANVEDGCQYSFAGQFESYLFVEKDELIQKINLCIASKYSKKVQHYCDSSKVNQSDIKIAVIVQKMVNSEFAGVCFTKNPVTDNNNVIIVEAVLGQGVQLVSGIVTPDRFIVEDNRVVRKELMCKKNISEKMIIKIANISKLIEEYFGMPMDVEWAIHDGLIYILQARPIT